jgi:hypothetical protein
MPKTWIDVTSDYWLPKTFGEIKENLFHVERDRLIALIINNRYNDFIRERADYDKDEGPQESDQENGVDQNAIAVLAGVQGGKRVPYVGWFWRSTNFYDRRIPIGNCGEFVGVMENNKWDYPERYLAEEECDQVIAILDAAMQASSAGGELGQIRRTTMRELERLWPLFQTFKID